MALELIQDQAYWLRRWQHVVLPVLSSTHVDLQALLPVAEQIRPKQLADIVLRDPIFTLQALRVVNGMPRGSYSSPVVDINNVILLLGPRRFIEQFSYFPALQAEFPTGHQQRQTALELIRNSRLAALLAWEWGKLRLDVKCEELYLAALLYPLREWLINTDAELQHALRAADPQAQELCAWLRTRQAAEIYASLLERWKFPEHLIDLIAENRQQTPRSQCVFLATRLAQALTQGWYQPEILQLITMTAEVLKVDVDILWPLIRTAVLKEARQHPVPEVYPLARLLPLLPSVEAKSKPSPIEAVQAKAPSLPKVDPKIEAGLKQLQALPKDTPMNAAIVAGLRLLQQAFGFERVALFVPNPKRDALVTKFVAGDDQLKSLTINLTGELLFARLAKKTQTLWLHGDNGPRLKSLLSADERRLLGESHWFAASFCVQDQIVALIFVDCRLSATPLDSALYQAFQRLAQELGQRFSGAVVKA